MDEQDAAPKLADHSAPPQTPVIVDLGKTSKKAIKKLKRGEGKLQREVDEAVHQVRLRLSDADKDKPIVPVVLIYRQKRRRGAGASLSLPFSPLNLFR
jgi:hypothetical protein